MPLRTFLDYGNGRHPRKSISKLEAATTATTTKVFREFISTLKTYISICWSSTLSPMKASEKVDWENLKLFHEKYFSIRRHPVLFAKSKIVAEKSSSWKFFSTLLSLQMTYFSLFLSCFEMLLLYFRLIFHRKKKLLKMEGNNSIIICIRSFASCCSTIPHRINNYWFEVSRI